MGYTTEFTGKFNFDRTIERNHKEYLNVFQHTRRMKRDPEKALLLPDPIRESVGLPIGEEGSYFVGGAGYYGQDDDASVVNHNRQSEEQPGLWCQWQVTDEVNCSILEWSGTEKFYHYEEWLQYLIDHFIEPWGYKLNGAIPWTGESEEDTGTMIVQDNVLSIMKIDV